MESGRSGLALKLKQAGVWILDAVFPEHCAACGSEGGAFCASCLAETAPRPRVGRLADGLRAVSFFAYGNPRVRLLLKAYKFHGRTTLRPTFETLLQKSFAAAPELIPVEQFCVVPIPLAARRRRERGFNQAEELAKILLPHLASGSRVELLLVRTRKTDQQSTLEKTARRKNVQGAFAAVGDLAGKRILLVDDVVTSGETLMAAASALRAAGAEEIEAFTFAEALDSGDR